MKATVQTLSVVCGTRACNARCPYCVSRMTGTTANDTEFNTRNFKIACEFAKQCCANTMLITGCGEPTLAPTQVGKVLRTLMDMGDDMFPFRELQTNGLRIGYGQLDHHLESWYLDGLTTIALSVAHFRDYFNRQIYTPDYIDLPATIQKLKSIGFMVRLSVMGMKGGIDNERKIDELIEWCSENSVDQITFRRIVEPQETHNQAISDWVNEHYIGDQEWIALERYVYSRGTILFNLMHGATVLDIDGQNFCMSNCLTDSPDPEQLRQLIYFPDGRLRYSWKHRGAILL